jgi:hypothetical protein
MQMSRGPHLDVPILSKESFSRVANLTLPNLIRSSSVLDAVLPDRS